MTGGPYRTHLTGSGTGRRPPYGARAAGATQAAVANSRTGSRS
jgi:hypothetical protein